MESSKDKLALTSSQASQQPFSKPLDYTFMCLTSISDCLEEEPRETNGQKPSRKETGLLDGPKKRKTNAIRLSNNVLTEWGNFSTIIEKIVENPMDLEWIDLSFNDLGTIDETILSYPNLKVLYLHGNGLEKLSEVDKLAGLPNLRTLTLHGNPIEDPRKGYKQYVLSKLPNLKTFDFSGVTKTDRACADTWSHMSKGKKKKKDV